MENQDHFNKVWAQLKASGRAEEILNEDGKVVISDEAFDWVEKEHPDKSDGDKYRLAQAQTMLALADKYAHELN